MKVQQASAAINNANIDLTIRKPRDFKPRKGYKLVHERYISGVAPTADSTTEAIPLNKMFENEKAEYRRAQELSFDEVNEDKLSVSPDSYGSEEHMHLSIEMEEMMAKLKSLEDKTLYIIGTMLNQEHEIKVIQDKLKDIQTKLHIDDERMEAYATEYITYYRSYID